MGLDPAEAGDLGAVVQALPLVAAAHLHLVHLHPRPVGGDGVVGGGDAGGEGVEPAPGADHGHPVAAPPGRGQVEAGPAGPEDVHLVGVDPAGGVEVDHRRGVGIGIAAVVAAAVGPVVARHQIQGVVILVTRPGVGVGPLDHVAHLVGGGGVEAADIADEPGPSVAGGVVVGVGAIGWFTRGEPAGEAGAGVAPGGGSDEERPVGGGAGIVEGVLLALAVGVAGVAAGHELRLVATAGVIDEVGADLGGQLSGQGLGRLAHAASPHLEPVGAEAVIAQGVEPHQQPEGIGRLRGQPRRLPDRDRDVVASPGHGRPGLLGSGRRRRYECEQHPCQQVDAKPASLHLSQSPRLTPCPPIGPAIRNDEIRQSDGRGG